MSIKIHARPNRNGNIPQHFGEAASQMYAASNAMRDAIAALRLNVVHGRNYQTVENSEQALAEDLKVIDDLFEMSETFTNVALAVAKAAGK